MKLENFKQTMKKYFEYMEACDRDGMLSLFAENAQIQDPPGVRGLGPPSKDAKPMTKQECGELWDHIFKEPRKTTGAMISAISSTVPNQYCGLIEFELEFEDGAKVPFFSVLICDMDHASRKIVRYRNFLSVSNLMNLFLTGEFKQCKTGKRVLEDYLKNYNQFNQVSCERIFEPTCLIHDPVGSSRGPCTRLALDVDDNKKGDLTDHSIVCYVECELEKEYIAWLDTSDHSKVVYFKLNEFNKMVKLEVYYPE